MPSLPALLPLQPFPRPARGTVALPGSKSLTNRGLLLAALCDQPVTLTGALYSDDTALMAEALRALGFSVEASPAALGLRVSDQPTGLAGAAGGEPVDIFVGLAGTAARFLTALCAALPRGTYRIDGVPQMRKRPMRPLLDALRTLGAEIRCLGEEGFFPLEVRAGGLRGGQVNLDTSESSQLLSALLMVAPLARSPVEITLAGGVRWPFVEMTARLMACFGQPDLGRPSSTSLRVANTQPYRAPAGGFAIEPDATAASYFLALPLAVGGALDLPGLLPAGRGFQGDTRFIHVLESVGLSVADLAPGTGVRASVPAPGARRGVAQDFAEFSDTFLTLAALAPLLAGPTRITGISHTRKQETDRVAGVARELKKLGQDVTEENDALTITPRPLQSGVAIETYGDHRFAMSFGILGCHNLHGDGRPWLSIRNPACCAKTFPDFFELLDSLREKSLNP